MKTLVFDTETTGLMPGSICQLSYILADNEVIKAKNYYFKVDYIERGAQMVHGLSLEVLDKLSNNKRFHEYINEIKADFEIADILISHNYEFDNRFLTAEFRRCNQETRFNKCFCTMKHFTPICRLQGGKYGYKRPRLEELAAFFRIEEKMIIDKTIEIFGAENVSFHDARYDVVTTYLCCMKAVDREMICWEAV